LVWGVGVGALGFGAWGMGPTPQSPIPQSPIPNPQSPFNNYIFKKIRNLLINILILKYLYN